MVDIKLWGATYPDVPSVLLPTADDGTAQFTDVTDTTATASDVASGKQFFDALGVLTQGTASGGGGASNVVTGTFKGTTTGTAMDINLDYSGTGYPIAVLIYPSEGAYKSGGSYYNLIQRYAIQVFAVVKNAINTAPTYNTTANDQDLATIVESYKNNASSSTSFGNTTYNDKALYNNSDASGSNHYRILKIRSAKKLSVFIASTSYGFAANIEYTYHVIYSS